MVGWYHSHPYSEPRPSQNDVLSHKKYQDATKTELGEEPCVGLIISEMLIRPHLLINSEDHQTIVEHLYSGHSVKQPPHYYSHLLRSLVI